MNIPHLHFIDDQYPNRGIDHVRRCARGVIVNESMEVALTKIFYDDNFGHRDYYELPGGGIKENESIIEAFQREIEEEIGFQVQLISPLARVDDFYNLIKRENHNYYFLGKTIVKTQSRQEEQEQLMIADIIWISLEKAIALYEKMDDKLISGLVKQRELPILRLAKKHLLELG
jgi:8-oxo-dGTP diphosphatase